LLRAAIGIAGLVEGGFYFAGKADSLAGIWMEGVVALAAGAALLLGLCTPFAAAAMGLGALGIAFSLLPAPAPNLLDAKLFAVLIAVVAAAIALLGPGAFSLDARLFGRREIIIPRLPE
jgi:uncharacterized membrane protein YphA (DoxX/SURF4 family)